MFDMWEKKSLEFWFFGVFCVCYEKCFNSFKNSFGSAENDVSDARTASNNQSDERLAKKESWQLCSSPFLILSLSRLHFL